MLLVVNIRKVLINIQEKVEIAVFLEDDLEENDINLIGNSIRNMKNIANVRFVNKDEAILEFVKDPEIAKQVAILETNPLPSAFYVRVKDKSYEAVQNVVFEIDSIHGIEDIRFAEKKVQRLERLLKYVYFGGGLIGFFCIAIVFILLRYVSKISSFYRKMEIGVLHSLGASDTFISVTLVFEGIILGIIASILGVTSVWTIFLVFSTQLPRIIFLPYDYMAMLCIVGVLLAVIAKGRVIKKCLKV